MKRRNFLGFMGGAAVAGPSMAKAGIESLAVPSLGNAANQIVGGTIASGIRGPEEPHDPLGWAKKDLARLLNKSAAQIMREKQGIQVTMLDPDLAAMRSLSLDTKIRIQRDRLYARSQEQERGWLEQRIKDLMDQPF